MSVHGISIHFRSIHSSVMAPGCKCEKRSEMSIRPAEIILWFWFQIPFNFSGQMESTLECLLIDPAKLPTRWGSDPKNI